MARSAKKQENSDIIYVSDTDLIKAAEAGKPAFKARLEELHPFIMGHADEDEDFDIPMDFEDIPSRKLAALSSFIERNSVEVFERVRQAKSHNVLLPTEHLSDIANILFDRRDLQRMFDEKMAEKKIPWIIKRGLKTAMRPLMRDIQSLRPEFMEAAIAQCKEKEHLIGTKQYRPINLTL